MKFLIRTVGVLLAVVGALFLPVALFVLFGLATIASAGLHQGPREMSEGTKLMAIKDSASALVVSAVLLTTGVGLFRLKSWARVTAQFFCALYVAVTVHSLAWGFRGLGEDGWPEPPFWIGLLVILAPFVFGILASLALPFAVLLQSKRAKECFG